MYRRITRAAAAAGAALTVGVLGSALAPAAASAQEATKPQRATLDGETFFEPGVQITNVHCEVDGQSTFEFSATGDASGPYTGAFTETGTALLGPQTTDANGLFPDAPWVRIDASFTISAGEGVVTGEKHLSDATYNFPLNEVVCATFPNPTAPLVTSGYAVGGTSDQMEYRATLSDPPGSPKPRVCKDKGQSYSTLVDANYEVPTIPGASFNDKQFFESFTSTKTNC
jgi:hypothetical protein